MDGNHIKRAIRPFTSRDREVFYFVSFCCFFLFYSPFSIGSDTTTYEYDPLGRLSYSEKGDGTGENYSYDDAGNRLTKTMGGGVANVPPNAVNDTVSYVPLYFYTYFDVRVNDTDANNDPLTIISVTQPGNGQVIIEASGTTLKIAGTARGTGYFTYTISDGNGGLDTADVSITVN